MKKIFLLILIISISFSSKIFSQNKDYLKEISFDFTYNVPIINVNINGETYNFLFDTGMPTAISKELNKKFKLNSMRSTTGSDINGNKSSEKYSVLKNLKIADIDFNNTEVLIANLKGSFEIECLQLDGVVGNNLIKNAIWEINYETKKIRFTNNIKNFDISKDFTKLNFKASENHYTPKVNLKINGKTHKNLMFDTGSNGGINLPIDVYSNKKFEKSIEYFGSSGVALYGRAKKNKSIVSKIENLEIGSLIIKNQLVVFNKKTPLIGNEFLSNFKIIIDYNKNIIYLSLNGNTNNTQLENFGFTTNIINNKIIITTIYKNTSAAEKLSVGDEILSINSNPVSTILNEMDSCYLVRKIFKENVANEFEIKHRKKILKLNVKKTRLIE